MISASLLMSMGSISIGGIIIRKILTKLGKVQEGNMIDVVTVIVVAGNMLETIIKTKEL